MRVDRAFAFVDLAGFTHFCADHGDEAAIRVLSVFRRVTREVATEYAVRIDKWLGDGALLVALDVAVLAEAVVEMVRRLAGEDDALPLRAGIAAGSVLMFEGDDYAGRVLNLAARLCDLAEANEVLVPAALLDAAPPHALVVRLGEREIRGLGTAVVLDALVPVPVHSAGLDVREA